LSRCSRIFTSTLINASAGCRVRKSKIRLYVAGRRVNVLLASSAALHIAPAARLREFCFLGFRARENFRGEFVSPMEQPSIADIRRKFAVNNAVGNSREICVNFAQTCDMFRAPLAVLKEDVCGNYRHSERLSLLCASLPGYSRGQKQPMICLGERTQI